MKFGGFLTLIYGLFVFIGGTIGYVKSGSLPSILAGGIFGALLLTASHMIFRDKPRGKKLALLYTIVLDGFFTYRFASHPKLFPAGIMLIASTFVLIMLVVEIKRKARNNVT